MAGCRHYNLYAINLHQDFLKTIHYHIQASTICHRGLLPYQSRSSILLAEERLHFIKIAIGLQCYRFYPTTYPFVNKQFAIIIIRQPGFLWKHIGIIHRAGHCISSACTYLRKIGRRIVRIPDKWQAATGGNSLKPVLFLESFIGFCGSNAGPLLPVA